jgi:hypothetical protein
MADSSMYEHKPVIFNTTDISDRLAATAVPNFDIAFTNASLLQRGKKIKNFSRDRKYD